MSELFASPVRPLAARWPLLLLGASVAGTLDISLATMFWGLHGVTPDRVLQSVASGLLGSGAWEGGSATALLGLLLHFGIAGLMVLAYDLMSLRLRWLVRKPLLAGPSYGIVLYVLMTWVVVPLSAATHAKSSPAWTVASVLSHVLLVGLPCALFVRAAQAPVCVDAGDAMPGAL